MKLAGPASLALLMACGGASENAPDSTAAAPAEQNGLTAFELEHGIGPVKEPVTLEEPDPALAAEGEALFNLKCMACHRLEERYIGPELDDVLDRRTPAYVLNMMMNPTEMTQRHPDAKALLAEYLAPMPSQDLTPEEARALLEYLRLADEQDDTN